MEYKVGDRAVVSRTRKVGEVYDGLAFTRSMAMFAGRAVTIQTVHDKTYAVEELQEGFNDSMFIGLEIPDTATHAELDNCPNPVMKGTIADLLLKDKNQQVEINDMSLIVKTLEMKVCALNKKYLATSGLTIVLMFMLILEVILGK